MGGEIFIFKDLGEGDENPLMGDFGENAWSRRFGHSEVEWSAVFFICSLEIQRDENEALKTALQTTLRAKEEDMKMYSDTIEETKKVFLQALRQYKQTVHGT